MFSVAATLRHLSLDHSVVVITCVLASRGLNFVQAGSDSHYYLLSGTVWSPTRPPWQRTARHPCRGDTVILGDS